MIISVHQLSSGYWHVRGTGPHNWAQPRAWPCSTEELRQHAHPEASAGFFQAAHTLAEAATLLEDSDDEH